MSDARQASLLNWDASKIKNFAIELLLASLLSTPRKQIIKDLKKLKNAYMDEQSADSLPGNAASWSPEKTIATDSQPNSPASWSSLETVAIDDEDDPFKDVESAKIIKNESTKLRIEKLKNILQTNTQDLKPTNKETILFVEYFIKCFNENESKNYLAGITSIQYSLKELADKKKIFENLDKLLQWQQKLCSPGNTNQPDVTAAIKNIFIAMADLYLETKLEKCTQTVATSIEELNTALIQQQFSTKTSSSASSDTKQTTPTFTAYSTSSSLTQQLLSRSISPISATPGSIHTLDRKSPTPEFTKVITKEGVVSCLRKIIDKHNEFNNALATTTKPMDDFISFFENKNNLKKSFSQNRQEKFDKIKIQITLFKNNPVSLLSELNTFKNTMEKFISETQQNGYIKKTDDIKFHSQRIGSDIRNIRRDELDACIDAIPQIIHLPKSEKTSQIIKAQKALLLDGSFEKNLEKITSLDDALTKLAELFQQHPNASQENFIKTLLMPYATAPSSPTAFTMFDNRRLHEKSLAEAEAFCKKELSELSTQQQRVVSFSKKDPH